MNFPLCWAFYNWWGAALAPLKCPLETLTIAGFVLHLAGVGIASYVVVGAAFRVCRVGSAQVA
jgi:hypothetical protein